MRIMGIEAVYAKPKLSQPGDGHKTYPYLLKGLKIAKDT
jgi:putative transposase